MASFDPNMQLYQRLKQMFPDFPDNVIISCVRKFPNDLQNCVSYLQQQSPNFSYPGNELVQHPKFDNDPYNHYESSRGYPIVGPGPNFSPNDPGRIQPCFQDPVSGKTYYTHQRSVSTSSASPQIGGYRSLTVPGEPHQPQSAPIMPPAYEPFRADYLAKVSGASGQPIPIGGPPHHHQLVLPPPRGPLNTFDSPRKMYYNQYNYEMRVSYNQALVVHQRVQMDRLQQKLNEDLAKLDAIRNQVASMEMELYNRIKPLKHPGIFNADEIKKLREETRKLRVECSCMSQEVDFLVKGHSIPLGETSEDFYKHINPGQSGSVGTPPLQHPSCRSPSPPGSVPISQEESEEGHQWSCTECTFLNNPALDKCEMCEMPRFMLASGFG